MIGKTLSHFRILAEIGKGGMGVVYKARDEKLRRDVALKVLPPELVGDEERRVRFLREARAAAAVNHSNIATIYEIDEAEGVVFIAMELVEGRTLRSLIRGRLLPIQDALHIATGIAEGLAEAHKARVIHRDLKPENIIVRGNQQPKILDFGLAKLLEERREIGRSKLSQADTLTQEMTREGRLLGTAAYMSPEQARGETVDARSDIFSFGTTLYEMVTGKLPFQGKTPMDTLAAIINKQVIPASHINPEVAPGMDRILEKCLEKEPKDRYRDSGELVVDLERLRGETKSPLMPRPFSIHGGLGRLKKLATLPALVVSTLVVVLVGLGIWWTIGHIPWSQPQVSKNTLAVLPFTVRGGEEVAYLGEGMVDLLSPMLEGAGDLRSVDPRALLSFIKRQGGGLLDPERGRDIAEQFGAGLYLLGTVVEVGGQLRISASLYDATGGPKVIAQATVEGEADQVFQLVDDLTSQLLVSEMGEPTTQITRLAGMTTDSLPALKHYLKGEKEFRKRNLENAMNAFQSAVSEDPSFALAWYRLSFVADWQWKEALEWQAAEMAVKHQDRLPVRDRRLLDARWAQVRGAADEAEQHYRNFLEIYPNNVEAWLNLGGVQFHFNYMRGRPLTQARQAFERVLQLEPENWVPHGFLRHIAGAEGNLVEFESLLRRSYPDGEYPLIWRYLMATSRGDSDAQEDVIAELRSADYVYLHQYARYPASSFLHDLEGSHRFAQLLIEPSRTPKAKELGYAYLAHLELAGGRWNAAKEQLKALRPYNPAGSMEYRALLTASSFLPVSPNELETVRAEIREWNADAVPPSLESYFFLNVHDGLHSHLRLYLLGLLSARLGDDAAAFHNAEELENLPAPEKAGTLTQDLAATVRAFLAWEKGSLTDALGALDKNRMEARIKHTWASSFYSHGSARYLRAELLNALGRYDEALPWYSNFDQSAYDIIYLAPSYLRRGEIYEKLGNQEEAIEHYTRFVELWQDCDPELRSIVDDAEARLERLKEDLG